MRGQGSLEKNQIWGLLFNCAPIFWCCCLWIVCLELCFVEGRIRAKKCFHKNRAASRVFIKILFCSTIFKGAPLWGAHGSRGHGGTWSGACEAERTPCPLRGWGGGLRQPLPKAQCNGVFRLWLAHANDERRGADALRRAQSCEYLFIMRIRRNGANAMRPLRLILARIMINIEQEK